MSRIVFLTLFLGLAAGPQALVLQVDPGIESVRILLGNRTLATLNHAPWETMVDLGPDLLPGLLTAIGFDGKGEEIFRTSQYLNLPRPPAETEIVVHTENSVPVRAELRWAHRLHSVPVKAGLLLDGKALDLDRRYRAALPRLDRGVPHILSAQVQFEDAIARSELVLSAGSGYSDSAASELTPILVRAETDQQGNLEGCFTAEGRAIRTSAVERSSAIAIFVQDPDPTPSISALEHELNARSRPAPKPAGTAAPLKPPRWTSSRATRRLMPLERDTSQRIMWPMMSTFRRPGQQTMAAFRPSADFGWQEGGVPWLLTRGLRSSEGPRRYTDAVAVAGLSAIGDGRRRVLVLVLDPDHHDESYYSPAVVRRYLQAIGVPFEVWSLSGPRPDLMDSWGEVQDVSTNTRLLEATNRLRSTLASQRVVWLATDAVTALRADAKPDCAVKTIASH